MVDTLALIVHSIIGIMQQLPQQTCSVHWGLIPLQWSDNSLELIHFFILNKKDKVDSIKFWWQEVNVIKLLNLWHRDWKVSISPCYIYNGKSKLEVTTNLLAVKTCSQFDCIWGNSHEKYEQERDNTLFWGYNDINITLDEALGIQ